MAIIRTYRTPLYNAAIIEDPIPGSTQMFFQLDAVNKSTLTPLFDTQINFSQSAALAIAQFTDDQQYVYPNNNFFGVPILSAPPWPTSGNSTGHYRSTGVLILNGEVTHCRHTSFNTANTYKNTIDFTPMYSMDPNRLPKQASYFTDGTNNVVYFVSHEHYNASTWYYNNTEYALRVNTSSSDLTNSSFMHRHSVIGDTNSSNSYWQKVYPMYRNPSTGNMIWHGQFSYSSTGTGYPS